MAEEGPTRWVWGVNEALLAKTIGFEGRFTLSTPSSSLVWPLTIINGLTSKVKLVPPLGSLSFGYWLLKMLLQDGRLLDVKESEEKGPLDKELVGRAEDLEVNKALEAKVQSIG